jgi:hypothetical protein
MKPIKSLEGKKVAIIGLGGSQVDYAISIQNSIKYDETWCINAAGSVYPCDRVFMLDPASRFLDSDDAGLQTDVMRRFLPKCKVPIYTCEKDSRVPNAVLYPLEEVCNATKCAYMNTTVAFTIAFAYWCKVGKIDMFGLDFSYSKNLHAAEAGRACVEFWISKCLENGIEIGCSQKSSLLDSDVPIYERLYGYHRLPDPMVAVPHDGKWLVTKYSNMKKAMQEKKINLQGEPVKPPEPYKG